MSIDIKKWIESEGKTVTVYKGTECGFFDSWTGSGSCIECETIRDFKISLPEHPLSKTDKYFQWTTTADEKCGNGYSTADVFGSGCFNHEEVTI